MTNSNDTLDVNITSQADINYIGKSQVNVNFLELPSGSWNGYFQPRRADSPAINSATNLTEFNTLINDARMLLNATPGQAAPSLIAPN